MKGVTVGCIRCGQELDVLAYYGGWQTIITVGGHDCKEIFLKNQLKKFEEDTNDKED